MGEPQQTKTVILNTALKLFAQRGFDATSMREIAAGVGIKASSLYKHFPSKQAIFDSLVQRELDEHAQASQRLGMPAPTQEAALAYAQISDDRMEDLAVGLLRHWCTGNAALFRRLVSAERLRSPEMARVYRRLFIDGPLEYETRLFGQLIELGAFKPGDAASMALQFWSPLLMLMEASDCGETQDDLEHRARAHIALFAALHATPVGTIQEREAPHE